MTRTITTTDGPELSEADAIQALGSAFERAFGTKGETTIRLLDADATVTNGRVELYLKILDRGKVRDGFLSFEEATMRRLVLTIVRALR